MSQQLAGRASPKFLELFGEFARDAELPIGEDVDTCSERFG